MHKCCTIISVGDLYIITKVTNALRFMADMKIKSSDVVYISLETMLETPDACNTSLQNISGCPQKEWPTEQD